MSEQRGLIPQLMGEGNIQEYRRLTPEIIEETFRDLFINRDPLRYFNPYWDMSGSALYSDLEDDDDIYIK